MGGAAVAAGPAKPADPVVHRIASLPEWSDVCVKAAVRVADLAPRPTQPAVPVAHLPHAPAVRRLRVPSRSAAVSVCGGLEHRGAQLVDALRRDELACLLGVCRRVRGDDRVDEQRALQPRPGSDGRGERVELRAQLERQAVVALLVQPLVGRAAEQQLLDGRERARPRCRGSLTVRIAVEQLAGRRRRRPRRARRASPRPRAEARMTSARAGRRAASAPSAGASRPGRRLRGPVARERVRRARGRAAPRAVDRDDPCRLLDAPLVVRPLRLGGAASRVVSGRPLSAARPRRRPRRRACGAAGGRGRSSGSLRALKSTLAIRRPPRAAARRARARTACRPAPAASRAAT